jgi:hypothetical protein
MLGRSCFRGGNIKMKSHILVFPGIVFLQLCFQHLSGQWVKTSGPYGADVTATALQGNYQFAGTSNGIYRAAIGSTSWEPGTLYGNRVQAILADSARVYAGTDHGLAQSSDFGEGWEMTALSGRIVTALTLKDSSLFAGTVNGVFVSSDKGLTWSEVDSGLVSKNVLAFTANVNMIFVSTLYDGLYRSSNYGRTWTKTNMGENAVFAVTFVGPNLLASSWDNVVFRSTDLGASWTTSPIGSNGTLVQHFATSGQKTFAATNLGVFESLDSGNVWQPVGLSSIHVHSISANNAHVLAGTGQGAYVSTDVGVNWAEMNSGLLSSDVTSLASSGATLFAGTSGFKVHRSTDSGSMWIPFNNGFSNPFVTGLGLSGDNLVAGTNGGIYLGSVSSNSWNRVSSYTGSQSFVFNGSIIIAGSNEGVLRSTDDGHTWKGIDSVHIGGATYQAWAVLTVGSTIIAGYNQRGIRISTNNGVSWAYSNTGLPSNSTINALAFSGGNILAGTTGAGIFVSSNEGTMWSQSALGTSQIWTFLVYGSRVFAGGSNGVFISPDNGLTWNGISQGLDGYFVYSLVVSGEHIFAGVSGGGVWQRPLSEVTSVSNNVLRTLPASFVLSQNYPNPFNPSTTIAFQLPHRSHVSLSVFDLLGRQMELLIDNTLDGGKHEVTFNADGYPTGVYFYRLKAGEFVQTLKMIVQR